MKCPYCEREMEKGVIQTCGDNLFWDQECHNNPIITRPSKEGIKLAYRPFAGAYLDPVYSCKKCKVLLHPYGAAGEA